MVVVVVGREGEEVVMGRGMVVAEGAVVPVGARVTEEAVMEEEGGRWLAWKEGETPGWERPIMDWYMIGSKDKWA